ncbi:MAG: gliding motility-associated C-terminal domain-containing protein [Saprospiraceae bacterium]|nr:gliding motility-associated C-terminal domain-containing protein [Saprospiraceae bacterium]
MDVATLKNPLPTISGPTSLCAGDTAKLSVETFTTYKWNNNSTTQNINALTSGTYTVTVTNSDGCIGTDDITINFNSSLKPVITGNLNICEGQSTILDAGTGYSSYTWSNGGNFQVNQVSTSGTYKVTVTSASGCKGVDSVVLNVLSKPSPAISGNLTICKGESTNITVNSSFAKYEWIDGSVTPSINVTKGGVYSVTVTNAGGCTGTAQVNVVENPLPTPTISGNLTICEGATTTLSANSGFAGYSWNTNETTASIDVTKSGNYTVTVSDANGCRNTKSVDVVVNPNPKPTVGGILSICDGNSTTLSVASTYQNYIWSSGENTFQINVTKAGDYLVTVTDSKGCKGTSSAKVDVADAPKVSINGSTIFCEGASTDLDAGTGFKSYLWSNGSTESKISISNAGQYSITVTNDAGCKGFSTISTSTINRPSAKILDDVNEYCPGDTILLSGIGGEKFKWITDIGIVGAPDTSDTYLITNATSNVTLAVSNICGSDTAHATFTILSSAIGGIAEDTISLLKGANVTLAATGGGTYSWISPYTLSCKNCSKPLLTPTESSNIYVIVTDKNGCKIKDSVYLNVELNIEDIIEVVNTITPNGDGKNDKLILKGLEVFENATLTVYNRWGDVVYNNKFSKDKTKIIEDAFDGTKNGLPLPAGTYYYVLKVLDTGKEFKSVLIIVRD